MKIILKKPLIVENFFNVLKAISTKTNVNVLEGFLITAQQNLITISGYDLETGITTTFPAQIEEEGSIVVNARLLTEIFRGLPSDDVLFESDPNLNVKITSGKSKYSLIGMNALEYPVLPTASNSEAAVILALPLLKSMIRQTIFSVADENETNPVHMGSLFTISEKTFVMVSVDGFRLAFRKETIEQGVDLKFIVPGKALKELLKIFPEESGEDDTVKIFIDTNHIIFNFNNYILTTRLLNGDFFDYTSFMTSEFGTRILVKTDGLIKSFERVSVLLSERLHYVAKCILSANTLTVSCTGPFGTAVDTISCEMEGADLELGVNPKFFIDALKHTGLEEVYIEFNGNTKPIKILPTTKEEFLFMVLPVRLNE